MKHLQEYVDYPLTNQEITKAIANYVGAKHRLKNNTEMHVFVNVNVKTNELDGAFVRVEAV